MSFIVPFYVGLLFSLQLMLLGLKATYMHAFSFGGSGFIVWLPSHIIGLRVIFVRVALEYRTVREQKVSAMKNDEAETTTLQQKVQTLETTHEVLESRLFTIKLCIIYIIVWIETLRETLQRYDWSIWVTIGPSIFFVLLFSFEGLSNNIMWWREQREIKQRIIEQNRLISDNDDDDAL